MKGTDPGVRLPNGGLLPLEPDYFTHVIRTNFNTAWFTDFVGVLDSDGRAAACFDTCGSVPAFIPVGTTLHFAFTTIFPFDVQSTALAVNIVP